MKMFEVPEVFPEDWPKEKRMGVIRDIGRKAKEEFDERYPSIIKWFEEYEALYILSFCAIYFLSYPEGTDPEAYKGELDFYYHYLEIMQAFALMQERAISVKPLAEKAEALRTEMKELGDLMGRRQYDVPDNVTEEELLEHILLWRMRDQTAAIRNWAYPKQMFMLTKGLARGVRDKFRSLYGIDPEKLVDLLIGIVHSAGEKLNTHLAKVRGFMKIRNYEKVIKEYNETWQDMVPISNEEAKELYKNSGESCRNLKIMLLAHSDLRLSDIYTFSLDDLMRLLSSQESEVALRCILDNWSFEFGDLKDHKTEYFVLDNPVLRKPFIKIAKDTYFSSILGILPHMTLGLLEGLVAVDKSLKKKYDHHKGDYLEEIAADLIKRNFPNGTLFRQSQWNDPKTGLQYENDLTVIIDSFAIVTECKAGAVSALAKRGEPFRFKRTLEDLILEPADQANRFIEYLSSYPGMHILKTRDGKENRIDTTLVNYYIPLTLTIEDLGFISSNIKEAINGGLIKREVRSLVPSMSVSALECVFELLDNEVEKIHYLLRRREFEHHVDYVGDELDLLGFYLENGFNIGDMEYTGLHISLANKSKELDPYFTAKEVGKTVEKPSLQMTKWWKDIINRVCLKRPKRWTELGFILLNSTKEDQTTFEYEMFCLRSRVKTGRVEHKHNWVTFLSGPEKRRYLIAGFPYKRLARTVRNSVMQDIFASEQRNQTRGAVCIGVNVETNEYPYSVIAAVGETCFIDSNLQTSFGNVK